MCGSGSVFDIRIGIQKAPEYGSNTNPDPQSWLKLFWKSLTVIKKKKFDSSLYSVIQIWPLKKLFARSAESLKTQLACCVSD